MSSEMSKIVEFGPFTLDRAQARLSRDGSPISLPPKVFDLLCYLVLNAGRLIEKEELLKALWPDTFVEEANLTVGIATLRKALGTQPDGGAWIETVPKRGYRFAGQISLPEVAVPPRNRPNLLAICSLGLVIVAVLIYVFARRDKPETRSAQSIGVLPFIAISGEPSLGMGMADALITRLSAISELAVRPISTIRKYESVQVDPIAAGKELNVSTVVTGTVQQIDKRLRVSVQLARVSDGQTLWSDKFDEFFTNMFAVQDAISEKLAHTLALRLSSEEQDRMMRRFTENAEAFRLYELGRYRSYSSPMEALNYYDAALKLDPRYALPYVDQAFLHVNLSGAGGPHFDLRMPMARRAAQKALELAPDFADAHAAMAAILHYADRDYAGARREIETALKINPQSARAHDKFAELLAIQGNLGEALNEERMAVDLDPFNAELEYNMGWQLYCSKRYAEAVKVMDEFERRDPRGHDTYIHYWCFLSTGKIDQAIAMIEERQARFGKIYSLDLELAYAHATAGRMEQARALLASHPQNERSWSYERGMVFLGLGDKDTAFEQLNRAIDEHSIWAEWYKVDPALEPLRSDPRFLKLLERMGLPR
jgi:DNA-binding winged helix-turn-helix (wHTH) protein/TolB-like protein